MKKFIFIVGSPRSGTTLTGRILNSHPKIQTWFAPYFIWDHDFRDKPDDVFTTEDTSPDAIHYIQKSFCFFKEKTGAEYVVDQSPRNSLKIPFIKTIFPGAKFIHVLRDSKDAILSIRKEWQKRLSIYQGDGKQGGIALSKIWASFKELISMQPLLKHKIQALLFEIQGFSLQPEKHYNRQRWGGRVGWGPRFAGWQEKIDKLSSLEFNALQWKECVISINKNLQEKSEDVFVLNYEKLLDSPENNITSMLQFIDQRFDYNELINPPKLMRGNYNKWKKEFSEEEIQAIEAILKL